MYNSYLQAACTAERDLCALDAFAVERWPREAAFVERMARGARRVARTLGAECAGCRCGTRGAVCARCESGSRVIYKAYIETYHYFTRHNIYIIYTSDVSSEEYMADSSFLILKGLSIHANKSPTESEVSGGFRNKTH